MDWFKANGVSWEPLALVQEVLNAIPSEVVVNYTKKGYERISAVSVIREDALEDRSGRGGVLVDPLKILKPVGEAEEKQWRKLQEELQAKAAEGGGGATVVEDVEDEGNDGDEGRE